MNPRLYPPGFFGIILGSDTGGLRGDGLFFGPRVKCDLHSLGRRGNASFILSRCRRAGQQALLFQHLFTRTSSAKWIAARPWLCRFLWLSFCFLIAIIGPVQALQGDYAGELGLCRLRLGASPRDAGPLVKAIFLRLCIPTVVPPWKGSPLWWADATSTMISICCWNLSKRLRFRYSCILL